MKALVFAALAILFACPAVAKVEYDDLTSSLKITGPTSSWQFTEVAQAMKEHEVDTVYMYGNGGEMKAGLAIGRRIFEEGARVIIPRDKACISACAFAALAAQEIHVDGELWLHRPFTVAVPSMVTIEDIAAHYGDAYLLVAEYMLEQGFSVSVTRQVFKNSSPCKFIVVKTAEEVAHARRDGFFVGYATEDRCGA